MYQPITCEKFYDKESETTYYITKIPYNNGQTKIKKGIGKDSFSLNSNGATIFNLETPHNFQKRKNAYFCINASSELENQKLSGVQVYNGSVLQNKSTNTKYWTLALKDEGILTCYAGTITGEELVNKHGVKNTFSFTIPIIIDKVEVDSKIYALDNDSLKRSPRQIISQIYDTKEIIVLTCDGNNIKEKGMTLKDCVRILSNYGVDFAYSLEGGSSAQTILNGEIMNTPCNSNNEIIEKEVLDFIYVENTVPEIENIYENLYFNSKNYIDFKLRSGRYYADISLPYIETDLNNITESGEYWVTTEYSNCPIIGTLLNNIGKDGYGTQYIIPYNRFDKAVQRTLKNGVWEEWRTAENGIEVNVKVLGMTGTVNGIVIDETNKLQEIVNRVKSAGGGTIIIPQGEYYIRNPVDIGSNIHIKLEHGAVITKKGGLGSVNVFTINKDATGIIENITIEGGTFDGAKLGLGIAGQRAKNLTFKDITFIDCQAESHIFDLGGVEDVLISNCKFIGNYPVTDKEYTECIQIDTSSKAGLPSFTGQDGSNCKNIIIEKCVFKPNPDDSNSRGFVCIGAHSGWNSYSKNIIFRNNHIEDCPYIMVRIPHVDTIHIENNYFEAKPNTSIIGIDIYSSAKVYDSSKADTSPSTLISGDTKYPSKNVFIRGNHFKNFTSNNSSYPVVKVGGLANYYAENIIIDNNIFENCTAGELGGQDSIQVLYSSNINVSNNQGNKIKRIMYGQYLKNCNINNNTGSNIDSTGISIYTSDNLSLIGNVINNCAQFGLYVINCQGVQIIGNNLNEIAKISTTCIAVASGIDIVVMNNLVRNYEIKPQYGTYFYKTSVAPAYTPRDNFTSNNYYEGVETTELWDSVVTGEKSCSGVYIGGNKILTLDTNNSVKIKNITQVSTAVAQSSTTNAE